MRFMLAELWCNEYPSGWELGGGMRPPRKCKVWGLLWGLHKHLH